MNSSKFVSEIQAVMAAIGGQPKDWYAGITKNFGARLFGNHNVNKNDTSWIRIDAVNTVTAREAEAKLSAAGRDGGTTGGDDDSRFVYTYLKTG